MIETVHIISFYSAEGESLYDTNRDEYIVDLTVDMIDSIKKETYWENKHWWWCTIWLFFHQLTSY